ncbi:MAG TPA: hypothetical protein VMR74_11420 [Gammaproteobacteria bacterium]|nr:hypothetical protein [Gammaproteobacteria bacterium]
MKKIDLGQTINTLANLGVLIGLVLLLVQLNQNNELMRAEAQNIVAEERVSRGLAVANSGEIAAIVAKLGGTDFTATELQALSPVEFQRL